jgi:hypothetical protein
MDEQHPTARLVNDAIKLADAVSRSIDDMTVAVELFEHDRLGNQIALFGMTAGVGVVSEELRATTLAILRSRRDHPDPFEGL